MFYLFRFRNAKVAGSIPVPSTNLDEVLNGVLLFQYQSLTKGHYLNIL